MDTSETENERFDEDDFDDSQGHPSVSQSDRVQLLTPRVKKGRDYVQKYLTEEGATLDAGLRMDTDQIGLDCVECGSTSSDNTSINVIKEKFAEIKRDYYSIRPQSASTLIINEFKDQILNLIEAYGVVILTGPTGCGKTTQVPQYILDSYMAKDQYFNIVVTQPRRIAAITVARRVCEEREWEVGKLCGYKVGLKDRTSPHTLLTYMTTGVLLQTLIKKKSLNQFTHIILDEIHERDQSMDFLLIVIKKLLNYTSSNTKVILMSATMEAQRFANYFRKKSETGEIIPPPVIRIDRQSDYSVDLYYLDDFCDLNEVPRVSLTDTNISEQFYDICIRLLKKFEVLGKDEENKSSVLIFLPGIYEIQHLYFKLKNPKNCTHGRHMYKWNPLPLHSSITVEEQADVFLPSKPDVRKIILATNIAESSITVPGVRYVIDFCLTKRLKNDGSTNFNSLHLCWASQASCVQRAGRVGRVMDGKVYRMIPRAFFEKLAKETTPEMCDAPLDRIILQIKMLDMGEPLAILALALDPPDLADIEWTILTLKEAGGLLRTRNGAYTPHDGDLTFLGRLMAVLPVEINITKLIAMGHIFGCLRDCLVIGASMSVKNVFSYPFRDRLKAYDFKLSWADNSFSDCVAFLNVYDLWSNHHETRYFWRNRTDSEIKWASRNFVQLWILREIKILIEELTFRLRDYQIEEPSESQAKSWDVFERRLILKVAIAGAFYPHYFCPGYQYGDTSEEDAAKEFVGRNPFTTVMLHGFPHDQPAELYYGVIKNYFRDISTEINLSSNSYSKIFVEFRPRKTVSEKPKDRTVDETKPGKIPAEVYRALKTRQARKNIIMRLLPPSEARNRAELLGIGRQFTLENRVKDNELIPCTLPGPDVSLVNIFISHVVNPGRFWAFYADTLPNQRIILHTIMKYSSICKPFEEAPTVGTMCIAPLFTGRETYFYRGRIESVTQDPKPLYEIFFVDDGSRRKLSLEEIRQYGPELRSCLREIPAQVFECTLKELRPSSTIRKKGYWSNESVAAFKKIIVGDSLVGHVYSVVRGVVSMELHKIDENQKDMNINDFLLKEKFAIKGNESKDSKANNLLRAECLLNDCRSSMSSQGDPTDDESEKMGDGKRIINVQLKGPTNPLEVTLYPCMRGLFSRCVAISEDSVNSVLLNTEPGDRHDRLVVAGNVTENASGTKLTLNHTTVMPNIHGLPALIPIMFAPQIEIRVDRARTMYTGVLCGLGADEAGQPLFPEHDMEIYFDAEITLQDISMVNLLRYYMSLILMADKHESYHTNSQIETYRKKIRSIVMKLLTKERSSQEPCYEAETHDWRRTNSDIMVLEEKSNDFNNSCIYPMHTAVFLPKWAT